MSYIFNPVATFFSRATTLPSNLNSLSDVGTAISTATNRALHPIASAVSRAVTAPAAPAAPPAVTVPSAVTDKVASVNIVPPAAEQADARRAPIVGGDRDNTASRLAALAIGGDPGIGLDPLGRRGRGAVGHSSLLGK